MKRTSAYYAGLAEAGLRKRIRTALADYMRSEGCGCCSNREAHDEHKEKLAKLLNVRKYKDGSGYDFSKYESKS